MLCKRQHNLPILSDRCRVENLVSIGLVRIFVVCIMYGKTNDAKHFSPVHILHISGLCVVVVVVDVVFFFFFNILQLHH